MTNSTKYVAKPFEYGMDWDSNVSEGEVPLVIYEALNHLQTRGDNIFYTAITRAKEKLKIYWSPETEKNVLGKLEIRNFKRDAYLLRQLYSL